MQLQSFFPQDDAGNLLLGGTATVYLKGTQTLATGLADAAGNPVVNPVPAAASGRIQFRAPMGDYDVLLEAEGFSLQVEASFAEAGDVLSVSDSVRSLDEKVFSLFGKNLVDPTKIRRGRYYSPASNTISGSSSYRCTGFIPVTPGETYAISGVKSGSTGAFFQTAEDNGVAIRIDPTGLSGGQGARTVPSGCHFLVVNLQNDDQDDLTYDATVQVEVGSVPTAYEPYGKYIDPADVAGLVMSLAGKADRDELIENVSYNMIDPESCDYINRYSTNSQSIIFDDFGLAASDYIPVREGEFYALSGDGVYGSGQGGFFVNRGDSSAVQNIIFASTPVGSGQMFQVPEGLGIGYVVLNLSKLDREPNSSELDGEAQLERGEVATAYRPYNEAGKIRQELLPYSPPIPTPEGGFDAEAWYRFVESDGGGVDLSRRLPVFREKWLSRNDDLVVINTGTSLTARSVEHCTPRADASVRPPLMHSNNYASHVWDKIRWEGQEYRRYDADGYFTESGSWLTSTNLEDWDDGPYRSGLTRYSEDSGASVSFVIPDQAWAFRFIYRTDSAGCQAEITIGEGEGLVQVYDESSDTWVEADGYSFSMNEPAPVSRSITVPPLVPEDSPATVTIPSKGNTTYQKRLKMRCRSNDGAVDSRSTSKSVTISRVGGGARMMYWGVEWSIREHMITYINAARGSHNTQTGARGLVRFQDNEVWGFKPDLMLFENPIHNDGSGNASGAKEGWWAGLTRNFIFEETYELSMVGSCNRLGIPVPEIAVFTASISWNFNGINEDGSLKFGQSTSGSRQMMTALDKYAEAHNYVVENHPDAVSIHAAQRWCDAAVAIFGDLRTATEASGKSGRTFTNEGSHWNDTGSKIMAKCIMPVIPRVW